MTDLKTRALRLTFPRSAERGPIEALRLSVSQSDIVTFPRSSERGLIERMSLSPLQGVLPDAAESCLRTVR